MKNIILALLLLIIIMLIKNFAGNRNFKHNIYKQEKLEENFKKSISFKAGKLEVKERADINAGNENPGKDICNGFAKTDGFYIPREGGFVYKEYTDGKSILSLDTWGLTFKPYGGIVFNCDKTFSPFIGARLFYYNSLGAGIICAEDGFMFCADKRLDSFLFFNNTALLMGINKNTAAFGAAVFF